MGISKSEILYSPKGPEWMSPKQFRTVALAYGIITGIISGALIIDARTEPAQPAHVNTVNDPVGK